MKTVTFTVLEGVDKGRVYRGLPTPVTIGREEGNLLRLNDERVSRFHAKVQEDNSDVILTDLESTNGTKVNGGIVQIRRLRPGDRVTVGRSLLLYGSQKEITERMATQGGTRSLPLGAADPGQTEGPATIPAQNLDSEFNEELDFNFSVKDEFTVAEGNMLLGGKLLPPLPQKLGPAQAARLAEILDFLHRGLTQATENIQANEEGTQITLGFVDWQKILAIQLLLARYLRAVAEPESLQEG